MAELICIVCPKGCHLHVDEGDFTVTGQGCPRGIAYGQNELKNPMRMLTSTVRVLGGLHRRLPVKTRTEIPKGRMFDAVRALEDICVTAPVKRGQVILADAAGTGVDIIATRDLAALEEHGHAAL